MWDEGKASVLKAMLVSAVQRRFPPGMQDLLQGALWDNTPAEPQAALDSISSMGTQQAHIMMMGVDAPAPQNTVLHCYSDSVGSQGLVAGPSAGPCTFVPARIS